MRCPLFKRRHCFMRNLREGGAFLPLAPLPDWGARGAKLRGGVFVGVKSPGIDGAAGVVEGCADAKGENGGWTPVRTLLAK